MEGLAYLMQSLMQLTQQHSMRLIEPKFNFEVHRLIPTTFSIRPLPFLSQHRFRLELLFAYFHFLNEYPSLFDDLVYSF